MKLFPSNKELTFKSNASKLTVSKFNAIIINVTNVKTAKTENPFFKNYTYFLQSNCYFTYPIIICNIQKNKNLLCGKTVQSRFLYKYPLFHYCIISVLHRNNKFRFWWFTAMLFDFRFMACNMLRALFPGFPCIF